MEPEPDAADPEPNPRPDGTSAEPTERERAIRAGLLGLVLGAALAALARTTRPRR